MTKRIFISDLHLENPQDQRFQRFDECLAVESSWAEEVYILGDLVEMWIGDDDTSELATSLADVLLRTSQHCRVFLMHGNRDFLLGQTYADRCHAALLSEPHVTNDNILLCHGDSLCTDDLEYQKVRQMLRSQAWQEDILGKSLAERQQLGAAMRAQSKAVNANKPTNIMDVNAHATSELAQQQACHTLIHGHTHRPGEHHVKDGWAYRRLVTGSWETCGWLCRQNGAHLQLECFSLARHYENETAGRAE